MFCSFSKKENANNSPLGNELSIRQEEGEKYSFYVLSALKSVKGASQTMFFFSLVLLTTHWIAENSGDNLSH